LQDYHRFLSAHLQYLTGLCQISIQSVNNSIEQFLSSLLVTSQLLSETSFQTRLDSQIKQSQSNAPVIFNQLLTLIENINDGNAIISTYETNFVYIASWDSKQDRYGRPFASTQPIIYDNNCSCGLHQNCTTQANFIIKNSSTTITTPIKGLKMGCTPSESFHSSTLECFYDSSCIRLIQEYTKSTYSPIPVSRNGSRFSINTTIAELTNDLFTETWKTTINYSSYFEDCAPLFCSYTYTQKLNSLYTLTLLLGLQGGLSLVLEWICPKIVRMIVKMYQRRMRRMNVVRPLSAIRLPVIESVSTSVANPGASSASIPESVPFQYVFFIFIFVKHDLKESVEVYKGRNLHPLPPAPPTDRDRHRSKVKGQRSTAKGQRSKVTEYKSL